MSARLRATGGGEGETREYSWGVYEFPVDYSVGRDYCDSRMMGRRPIHNLVRKKEGVTIFFNCQKQSCKTQN